MKFTCDSTLLQNILQNSLDFCSQKSISNSSFVLLTLNNSLLNIRTTDGKMGFDSSINVKGEENGSIALPCDKFLNIIKTFNSENIVLENKDESFLYIKSENKASNFKIKYNDSSIFPKREEVEGKKDIEIESTKFINMINQSIISVNETYAEDNKAVFNGVLMDIEKNKINMVSTDGKSMSYIQIENKCEPSAEGKKIVIPARFLKEVSKIFKIEEFLNIYIRENAIFIKNSNTLIYSSLYKGQFPNYKRVLDANTEYCLVYKVEDMLQALRKVILMADNSNKRIIFKIKKGLTTISSVDNDLGSASDELENNFEGEEIKFALNYSYLLNQVKALTSDYLKMEFTNSDCQIRIRPTNEENYVHIIMPMSLN